MASFEILSTVTSTDFFGIPEPSHLIFNNDVENPVVIHDPSVVEKCTLASDVKPDQIHHWLNELINGSVELKASLQKTNASLNEQLTTILSWHKDVLQQIEILRDSLMKAKHDVSVLQTERDALFGKLQQLQNNLKIAERNEQSCCNSETASTTLAGVVHDLKVKQDELTSELEKQCHLNNELQQQISTCVNDRETLFNSCEMLKSEKHDLIALNNELRSQLYKLKVKIARSENEATVITDEESGYNIVFCPDPPVNKSEDIEPDLKDALLQLHNEHLKVDSLTQQLKQQQQENAELKASVISKVTEQETNHSCPTCVNSDKQVPASVVQKLEEDCLQLKHCIQDYQIRLEQLQQTDSIIIKQLEGKVKSLQDSLHQERLRNEIDKVNLQEAMSKFDQLSQAYEKVTSVLVVQEQEKKTNKEQIASLKKIEQVQHIEQIDVLTAKLLTAEQQLEDAESKMTGLKKEVATLKEDSEAIPILKAQVELYKMDFETEKAARECAQNEVERLTHEVKSLRKLFETSQESQAQESFTSFRDHKHSKVDGKFQKFKKQSEYEKKKKKHGPPATAPPHEPALLSCPSCTSSFTEVQVLESHVEECLRRNSLSQ